VLPAADEVSTTPAPAPKPLKRPSFSAEVKANITAFFSKNAAVAAAASGNGTPAARSRRPTPSVSFDYGSPAVSAWSPIKAAGEEPTTPAPKPPAPKPTKLQARVSRVFKMLFSPDTTGPARNQCVPPAAAITAAATCVAAV